MVPRIRRRLLAACERHAIHERGEHTVPEPYIPRLPADWNGRIVLAEAQNHGRSSSAYVSWLLARGPRGRVRRLDFWENGVGIQPWDDGTLKLAVEAAFTEPAERWAVSNAVLWSRVTRGGWNGRPSKALIQRSIAVWADFLRVLEPRHVVSAGKVAAGVMAEALRQAGLAVPHTVLMSSSPTYLRHQSPRHDPQELLQRCPAVADVIRRHPEWLAGQNAEHKVFYACHAVSTASGAAMEGR